MSRCSNRVLSKLTKRLLSKGNERWKTNALEKNYCASVQDTALTSPEKLFTNRKVRELLVKMTGVDMDKVFRERLTDIKPPKYKLMTEDELHVASQDVIEKTAERLQMPPIMRARKDKAQVVSKNPEIAGFDLKMSKYIFTDITYGKSNRTRTIIVRDQDGTLRHANHEERDRMQKVYHPREGQKFYMPTIFEEQNLEKVLMQGNYEYILDRACVQFEPDDPQFIRVSHRTYEHIENNKKFDDLRSTRHFGGLAFYLTFNKKIDSLLVDMIQRDLISDAGDLVRLFHIIHPGCKSAQEIKTENIEEDLDIVKIFASNDAKNGGLIDLALQTLSESMDQMQSQHE